MCCLFIIDPESKLGQTKSYSYHQKISDFQESNPYASKIYLIMHQTTDKYGVTH